MQTLMKGWLQRMALARPGARSMLANTGWLVMDRVVRLALALSVGAMVARHFGPGQFGELTYAVTLIALFQGITNLGADGILVRDLSRDPGRAAASLGTALRLRLVAGAACWGLATLVVYLLRPHDLRAVTLTAIIGASLVFQSAETVDLWFQSQSRNVWTVRAKLLAYLGANGLRILLLLNDAPLWAFAIAALMDSAFLAFALRHVYRRFPVSQRWAFDPSAARQLLRESAPFMVSGVAALLYMRIDQIMIRQMLGEQALGYYSAAVPLSQVWGVIPVTLATALAPFIARKKRENDAAYMAALAKVFKLFAAISVVAVALTIALADIIVRSLYGHEFEPAAPILALHVVSNVFVFLGVAQGLWLINEGHGRMTLYRTALGALTSVIGNWIFIPMYGVLGSAGVTVAAQFVAVVASNAVFAPAILKMQLLAFTTVMPRSGRT